MIQFSWNQKNCEFIFIWKDICWNEFEIIIIYEAFKIPPNYIEIINCLINNGNKLPEFK
jgi:hypothetical protein